MSLERPTCQTISNALEILSASDQAGPDLLTAPAVISKTTSGRSAIEWEDLKPYRESKNDLISQGDQHPLMYNVRFY